MIFFIKWRNFLQGCSCFHVKALHHIKLINLGEWICNQRRMKSFSYFSMNWYFFASPNSTAFQLVELMNCKAVISYWLAMKDKWTFIFILYCICTPFFFFLNKIPKIYIFFSYNYNCASNLFLKISSHWESSSDWTIIKFSGWI